MDKVKNWSAEIPKKFKDDIKLDKNYKNHLIKPCSMILAVGTTGSGKTNGVLELLSRTNGKWFEIILFSGSNVDEPMYRFLQEEIPDITVSNNPEELPRIEDYEECDKNQEKLIIFDDSVLSDAKTLKAISKWFMMARKLKFTVIMLTQDYTTTPIFIRRNLHYLELFKITDNRDLLNIFSKVASEIDPNIMMKIYKECTATAGNFLMINMRADNPKDKYHQNYIGKIF